METLLRLVGYPQGRKNASRDQGQHGPESSSESEPDVERQPRNVWDIPRDGSFPGEDVSKEHPYHDRAAPRVRFEEPPNSAHGASPHQSVSFPHETAGRFHQSSGMPETTHQKQAHLPYSPPNAGPGPAPSGFEHVQTKYQDPRDHINPPDENLNEYLIRAYCRTEEWALQPRRTLDQYAYAGVTTADRDNDQVVYRYIKEHRKHSLLGETKIFMTDQLWMWILGDGISFPIPILSSLELTTARFHHHLLSTPMEPLARESTFFPHRAEKSRFVVISVRWAA